MHIALFHHIIVQLIFFLFLHFFIETIFVRDWTWTAITFTSDRTKIDAVSLTVSISVIKRELP